MAQLLWALAWLPQLYAVLAMVDPPQPHNLTLTSHNMVHLLRWEPGPDSPAGLHFSVSVCSERGCRWVPVDGCQHVQHPLTCNLTEAFTAPLEAYFSRVRAQLGERTSKYAISESFFPIRDTVLDLPLLDVAACGLDVCARPRPPDEHLRQTYNTLGYQYRLSRGGGAPAEPPRDSFSLEGVVFTSLAPGTQYCVSIRFADSLVPRQSDYGPPRCAFTPSGAPHAALAAISCVLVVPLLVGVALLYRGGVICLRVKRLPAVLTSITHADEPLLLVLFDPPFSPPSLLEQTAPPAGRRRSSSPVSDEDSGESDRDTSAGSSKRTYQLWPHPSAFGPSSPPSDRPAKGYQHCQPNLLYPQSHAAVSEDHHTTAQGPCQVHHSAVEAAESEEEEGEEEWGCGQDVNLITLTLGLQGEDEENEEEEADLQDALVESEEPSDSSDLPLLPHTSGGILTAGEEQEEDEDEEYSQYLHHSLEVTAQTRM